METDLCAEQVVNVTTEQLAKIMRDRREPPMSTPNRDELAHFLKVFAADAPTPCVVELRALQVPQKYGKAATECGFFEIGKPDPLKAAVSNWLKRGAHEQPEGVYATLNPVNPALLARAENRVKTHAGKPISCTDKDVVHRRWLLIDVDPVRPSGVSATAEEKAAAQPIIEGVRNDLRKRGWPDPMLIDSGNGYHAWYRIDLPADDGGIVERTLKALAAVHDTPTVKLDTSVFNAGRIVKLPGTWSRKGDSTRDRPHRLARVLTGPDAMQVVPRSLLESLASEAPKPAPRTKPPVQGRMNESRLLVGKWLDARGVSYTVKDRQGTRGQDIYILSECPFNPDHRGQDVAIMQETDGTPAFHCFHASCSGRTIKDVFAKLGKPDPDHYEPPLMTPRATKPTAPVAATPRQQAPQAPPPAADDAPRQGWEVIRDHFQRTYAPVFRIGDAIYSETELREVRRIEACAALPPSLIGPLGESTNAPRFRASDGPGAVNAEALPGFFRKWAGTAWAALLERLPTEDAAELGSAASELVGEEFRRLVREAMLTPIVFGQTLRAEDHSFGETKFEKRPLAEWCRRFAKTGPWRDVRELKCWCKATLTEGGELIFQIAIRHELFAQIKADSRLREMGTGKFTKRAERYGVGKPGGQGNRPHGQWAIVLDDTFVADLIGTVDVEQEFEAAR